MSANLLCDTLRLTLPALFECEAAPRDGVCVHTPMLYPDGGEVEVYVLQRSNQPVVTDHGNALGWLKMQTTAEQLSPRVRKRIEEICALQGVSLERGRLIDRCSGPAEVADAVQRVAVAIARVSDIAFTQSPRYRQSIADEVEEWLTDKSFDYERKVKCAGQSSRQWTVDYRVRTDARMSLVFLLSTRSQQNAPRLVERVLAGCVDLGHMKRVQSSLSFVSLFDDTTGVWRNEDFQLVESHSTVALWSRPDQFEQILLPA